MISPQLANVIGFSGMICIIAAYAYQTASKRTNPFIQHSVNLLGAILLTISLTVFTTLASLVLEGFWAAIAIFGLARAFRDRRRQGRKGQASEGATVERGA